MRTTYADYLVIKNVCVCMREKYRYDHQFMPCQVYSAIEANVLYTMLKFMIVTIQKHHQISLNTLPGKPDKRIRAQAKALIPN